MFDFMSVCVRVCVCLHICVCVRVRVCACMIASVVNVCKLNIYVTVVLKHIHMHARTYAHTQQIYTCFFVVVKHYPIITYFRSRLFRRGCHQFPQQMHQFLLFALLARFLQFTTSSHICYTRLTTVTLKQLLFGLSSWNTSSQAHQGFTIGQLQNWQALHKLSTYRWIHQ